MYFLLFLFFLINPSGIQQDNDSVVVIMNGQIDSLNMELLEVKSGQRNAIRELEQADIEFNRYKDSMDLILIMKANELSDLHKLGDSLEQELLILHDLHIRDIADMDENIRILRNRMISLLIILFVFVISLSLWIYLRINQKQRDMELEIVNNSLEMESRFKLLSKKIKRNFAKLKTSTRNNLNKKKKKT